MSEDPAFVDVCVCTFRRPHIVETLRSLARQSPGRGRRLRVIVVDNDDTPSARARVLQAARDTGLSVTYLHAPARNISRARNAGLAAASAPLLAFFDDDQVADPRWLQALLSKMDSTDADVVLGPVVALYRPGCPDWLRRADFHSTRPRWSRGRLVGGGMGNALLRRDFAPALRFREELGRSGGEDTVYFHALAQAGARFALAAGALATEPVPEERESLAWLMRRRFRAGQTHGLLLREDAGGRAARAAQALLAAAKAGLCLCLAAATVFSGRRSLSWGLRGALHAGAVSRLLGAAALEPYGRGAAA